MCAIENTGFSILRCFLWVPPYVPSRPGPRRRRIVLSRRQDFRRERGWRLYIPNRFLSPVVVVLVLDIDAIHCLRVIDVQHPRLYNSRNVNPRSSSSERAYTKEPMALGERTIGLNEVIDEFPTVMVEDLEHVPCRHRAGSALTNSNFSRYLTHLK